jgi:hypothetical protein
MFKVCLKIFKTFDLNPISLNQKNCENNYIFPFSAHLNSACVPLKPICYSGLSFHFSGPVHFPACTAQPVVTAHFWSSPAHLSFQSKWPNGPTSSFWPNQGPVALLLPPLLRTAPLMVVGRAPSPTPPPAAPLHPGPYKSLPEDPRASRTSSAPHQSSSPSPHSPPPAPGAASLSSSS